jgi:hypothetical protein
MRHDEAADESRKKYGSGGGQDDGKRGPPIQPAMDHDLSVMRVRDGGGNIQPQTGAGFVFGETKELFENFLQIFFTDPDTRVGDVDRNTG